jgi:hypothetical protein
LSEQGVTGATLSIGLAMQERQSDLGALVADAARALEMAMVSGGNRVVAGGHRA